MTEYQLGKAKVRIHGKSEPDKIREATEKFLKKAERIRNEQNKKKDTVQQKN